MVKLYRVCKENRTPCLALSISLDAIPVRIHLLAMRISADQAIYTYALL